MRYQVEIKYGNLVLEENADFIVNASNTTLKLGSGVSMAFARHCGQVLQADMKYLLSEIHASGHSLQKGDVVPSLPGNATNFKYALHAATIDYNPGVHRKDAKPCLEDIDKALLNIHKIIIEYSAMHQKKRLKLVLPLLGCGVGGLEKQAVMDKYLEFFEDRSSSKNSDRVCDVVIYLYEQRYYN